MAAPSPPTSSEALLCPLGNTSLVVKGLQLVALLGGEAEPAHGLSVRIGVLHTRGDATTKIRECCSELARATRSAVALDPELAQLHGGETQLVREVPQ